MGRRMNAFASDDNHNEGSFEDSCGVWTCVQAPDLSQTALEKYEFYRLATTIPFRAGTTTGSKGGRYGLTHLSRTM